MLLQPQGKGAFAYLRSNHFTYDNWRFKRTNPRNKSLIIT